jgi:hypothetical protein
MMAIYPCCKTAPEDFGAELLFSNSKKRRGDRGLFSSLASVAAGFVMLRCGQQKSSFKS